MRVATIVGNRPQFVKAAAVSAPLRAEHEELLIHTGQHHDPELSAVFFEQLDLPAPDHWLGVAGASNVSQLARMLAKLGPLLVELAPDVVLVYGDTNSTLAGALAAADRDATLVHVEAGMRSFDRSMPEERNRVLTDQLARLLLCSTPAAVERLRAEQVPGEAVLVGDVMVDVALGMRPRALADTATLERLGLGSGAYVLATAHRAANVDDPARLESLVALLEAVPEHVVLPLHPRTRARLRASGLAKRAAKAAQITSPLGYLEFAALMHHATAILTDSGGVQKEAYLAGVPCITLRDTTEWTETVEAGWNTLVGLDKAAALAALAKPRPQTHPPLYGDGQAGERIVQALAPLERRA
jgi:UDP-N-acetylglucosamine 2-epimerase (non-hydrolysing)/UDP-GlcNAc3NAcA epimerase